MAVKYAVASGAWSSTDIWSDNGSLPGGAALPVDGDSVEIMPGVEVWMDVDQSAWSGVHGIQGIIFHHGPTPPMLYWKDGASGYLRIKPGYSISCPDYTSGNRPRILANQSGTWGDTTPLSFQYKAVIDLNRGMASQYGWPRINAANLQIALYCTEPQTKLIRVYGEKMEFTASAQTVDVESGYFDIGATKPATETVVKIVPVNGTLPDGLDERETYYVLDTGVGNRFYLYRLSTSTVYGSEGPVFLKANVHDTGSGTLAFLTEHTDANATTLNVFDDISGETEWDTTSGENGLFIFSCKHPYNLTEYTARTTLAAKSATQIELGSAVGSALNVDCVAVFTGRNVRIILGSYKNPGDPTTNMSQTTLSAIRYGSLYTHGGVFQCEMKDGDPIPVGVEQETAIMINGGKNITLGGSSCGVQHYIRHGTTASSADSWIIDGVYDFEAVPDGAAGSTYSGMFFGVSNPDIQLYLAEFSGTWHGGNIFTVSSPVVVSGTFIGVSTVTLPVGLTGADYTCEFIGCNTVNAWGSLGRFINSADMKAWGGFIVSGVKTVRGAYYGFVISAAASGNDGATWSGLSVKDCWVGVNDIASRAVYVLFDSCDIHAHYLAIAPDYLNKSILSFSNCNIKQLPIPTYPVDALGSYTRSMSSFYNCAVIGTEPFRGGYSYDHNQVQGAWAWGRPSGYMQYSEAQYPPDHSGSYYCNGNIIVDFPIGPLLTGSYSVNVYARLADGQNVNTADNITWQIIDVGNDPLLTGGSPVSSWTPTEATGWQSSQLSLDLTTGRFCKLRLTTNNYSYVGNVWFDALTAGGGGGTSTGGAWTA